MLTRTEGNFKQRPSLREVLRRKCENSDHNISVATEGKGEELGIQIISSLKKNIEY